MKLWNSTLNTQSKKGRATAARDARTKARLIELHGKVCFFEGINKHECPRWVPDNRQEIEHMHILGKRTHRGGAKKVRFDTGFSVLGCWYMHDQEHVAHELEMDAQKIGDEVHRTFFWLGTYKEDIQPSEVIE
jgi:hypothetical protein